MLKVHARFPTYTCLEISARCTALSKFYCQDGLHNALVGASRRLELGGQDETKLMLNGIAKGIAYKRNVLPIIEITQWCNLRCRGCYVPGKQNTTTISENELKRIIDCHPEAAFFSIQGGEPISSLTVDWIGRVLRSYPKTMFMFITNGTYISHTGTTPFPDLTNIGYVLSINGDEERHNLVRGRGSFQDVVNAARIIKQEGKVLAAAVCVVPQNLSYIKTGEIVGVLHGMGICAAAVMPASFGEKHLISNDDWTAVQQAVRVAIRKAPGIHMRFMRGEAGVECAAPGILSIVTYNRSGVPRTNRTSSKALVARKTAPLPFCPTS